MPTSIVNRRARGQRYSDSTHHVRERAGAAVGEGCDNGVLLDRVQACTRVRPPGQAVPGEGEVVPRGVVEVRREVLPAVVCEDLVEQLRRDAKSA